MKTIKNEQGVVRNFLKSENIFAVLGASRDPEKYGHKVFKDLKESGYTVFPVNPKADELLGRKVYKNLKELPKTPDVVDIVVPPSITEKIVKECKKLGIDKIWMQPGSESEKAEKFCKKHDIKVLSGICVMRELDSY